MARDVGIDPLDVPEKVPRPPYHYLGPLGQGPPVLDRASRASASELLLRSVPFCHHYINIINVVCMYNIKGPTISMTL